ncbi:MAG: DNA glycosylase [Eubacteriales bacterium]|nr:DNA glycosylase [Eubacteriales bacterium]
MYEIALESFSASDIAESGQCFRMSPLKEEGAYKLVAFGKYLKIVQKEDGKIQFHCSENEFNEIWKEYFDLNRNYSDFQKVALEDDIYLKQAIAFGKGIRILNQEPWEMLISFIISQRKSVPAIRTSVERLSERLGKPIYSDNGSGDILEYSFPSPEKLAEADIDILSECGLGYRTEYVANAARSVLRGDIDFEFLKSLETDHLIEELMKQKGVGIKVASCVALFGFHRLDVVPVDVWMKRVIDTVYNGELPKEYKPYAGVIQQYLFNYARLNGVEF